MQSIEKVTNFAQIASLNVSKGSETCCYICAEPIENYTPRTFFGTEINPACKLCYVESENDDKDDESNIGSNCDPHVVFQSSFSNIMDKTSHNLPSTLTMFSNSKSTPTGYFKPEDSVKPLFKPEAESYPINFFQKPTHTTDRFMVTTTLPNNNNIPNSLSKNNFPFNSRTSSCGFPPTAPTTFPVTPRGFPPRK